VAVVVQVPDTPPLPLAVAPYSSAVGHETVEVLAPEVVAAAVAVADAVEAVADAVADAVAEPVDPDADAVVPAVTDDEVAGPLVVETTPLVLVTEAVLLPAVTVPEVLETTPVPAEVPVAVTEPVDPATQTIAPVDCGTHAPEVQV